MHVIRYGFTSEYSISPELTFITSSTDRKRR